MGMIWFLTEYLLMNHIDDLIKLKIYKMIPSYTDRISLISINKDYLHYYSPFIIKDLTNIQNSNVKCQLFLKSYETRDIFLLNYLETLIDFDPLFYNVGVLVGIKLENYALSDYCINQGADNLDEAYTACLLSNKDTYIEQLFSHYQTRISLTNYIFYYFN